jgi:polyisoprenoid-binding protein YceI
MRYLFLALFASSVLFASNLTFLKGSVLAHTSVFGDSTINPATSHITSHLKMQKDVGSLHGSVDVSLIDLKSDNAKRDEHMYEAIDTKKYTKATYTIDSLKKQSTGKYIINGTLLLHGVKKPIALEGMVSKKGNTLHIQAKTSFKMSSFGITPPKMFFLTVRDRLDMKIDTTYKIK